MEYTGSVRTKRGKNGRFLTRLLSKGNGIPSPANGCEVTRPSTVRNGEAIRLMNQIVAEKNAGTYFKAVPPPATGLAGTVVPDYCTGHLEKTTLASYRDKIDHYINPVLGNIPLGN